MKIFKLFHAIKLICFVTLYTILMQQLFSMKPAPAKPDASLAIIGAAPLVHTGPGGEIKLPATEAPLVRTGSGGEMPDLTPLKALDYASWNMHDDHSSGLDLTGKRPSPTMLDKILQGLGSEEKILNLINTNFFDSQYIDEKTVGWLIRTALHRISNGVVLPVVFPPGYTEKSGEREFCEKLNERQFAYAQVLLNLGASLLILDSRRCTPMHIVASTGRDNFVELYAQYEPSCVNARGGKKNSTPLMTAVALHKNARARMRTIDNRASIQMLLTKHADVNLFNLEELTALDLACDPTHPERAELIPMLRKAGGQTADEIRTEKELLQLMRNFHQNPSA